MLLFGWLVVCLKERKHRKLLNSDCEVDEDAVMLIGKKDGEELELQPSRLTVSLFDNFSSTCVPVWLPLTNLQYLL